MLADGIFGGKLFDNYGPRYLLVAGTFLHVFGLMLTSISKTYYQILLSQAVCSATGASFSVLRFQVYAQSFQCWQRRLTESSNLGINMVPGEARRRTWPRCRWLIPWRYNLPSHDHQSASSSRLRLDHSRLCLPDPGALAVCKLCSQTPYRASEAPHRFYGIRPATARAGLCLMDCCSLFLLLCAGQTP